jgi:hypothetical protein
MASSEEAASISSLTSCPEEFMASKANVGMGGAPLCVCEGTAGRVIVRRVQSAEKA